jgi:hypothetical protein
VFSQQAKPSVDTSAENSNDDSNGFSDVEISEILDFGSIGIGTEHIALPQQKRCASHTLALVAKKADPMNAGDCKVSLRSAMAKVKALTNSCSRSSQSKEACHDILGKQVPVPCATRWNSHFDSYSFILHEDIKPKINQVFRKIGLEPLKQSEFDVMEEYVLVMKNVAIALDGLQGESTGYVYGLLLPTISTLVRRLGSLHFKNSGMGIMRDHVLQDVRTRFNYLMDPLSDDASDAFLATMTHPTLRKFILLDSTIKKKAQEIFLEKLRDFVNEDNNYVSAAVAQPTIKTPLLKFLDLPSTSQTAVSRDISQDEGIDFLSDMSDESLSLLRKYPSVKRMYMRYNVTMPSSAPVERLFSYAGMVFTKKRNRLTDEHLEQYVLLKANRA